MRRLAIHLWLSIFFTLNLISVLIGYITQLDLCAIFLRFPLSKIWEKSRWIFSSRRWLILDLHSHSRKYAGIKVNFVQIFLSSFIRGNIILWGRLTHAFLIFFFFFFQALLDVKNHERRVVTWLLQLPAVFGVSSMTYAFHSSSQHLFILSCSPMNRNVKTWKLLTFVDDKGNRLSEMFTAIKCLKWFDTINCKKVHFNYTSSEYKKSIKICHFYV